MINDLTSYRLAKVVSKDLKDIVDKLIVYNSTLEVYNKYTPIQDIQHNISVNVAILKIHLQKYQEILDNKGRLDDSME